MDPYQTLGVPKDCSREKVKEVFRARARRAHPDRGGAIPEFVQLRKAYEQILADLDRNRIPMIIEPSAQAAGQHRQPKPPAPPTVPDFLWLDETPRRDRKPKPPDPNWAPDFVLLDEPLSRIRPPRPVGPEWEPDFVLLDDEPRSGGVPLSPDPGLAEQSSNSWLRPVAERASRQNPSRQPRPFDMIWMIIIVLEILFLTVSLIWALSGDQPTIEAQATSFESP